MAIPTIVKQLTDSILRSKDVFSTIIEYDKSEVHSDVEMKKHRLGWRDFRPNKVKNDYLTEFKYVRDEQQYAFRLRNPKTDEISFIQFIYHFSDAGELLENSQLYYYPPLGFKGYTTEELFDIATDEDTCAQLIELEGAFEQKFDIENLSHIRVDFSRKYHQPIVHPLVHFHFGAINNFRLALTKFPTPFMFMSLIAKNFFKEEWEKVYLLPSGLFDKAKYNAEIVKTPTIVTDSFADEEMFFIHHK